MYLSTRSSTYSLHLRVEFADVVMQHWPVYPHDLFLGRERHVDDVELGQQPIRDNVPPTSRRTHRHQ